ncbi:hypothetical protein SLEP1_g651 [Rubroshorea leprosula]|uniref:Uncharacterized protein n=1 Tax=Rubroshorea leprosula TaxID=152421 RepID=A0AAV5HKN0_9ROSI|nr:hypothetical protein SLEP1_g651 [Rubroshorea leprosula]
MEEQSVAAAAAESEEIISDSFTCCSLPSTKQALKIFGVSYAGRQQSGGRSSVFHVKKWDNWTLGVDLQT